MILGKAISRPPEGVTHIDNRYDEFERLIRSNFEDFNRRATQTLAQYILSDGTIDYIGLRTAYQRLAEQFAAGMNNVIMRGANLSAKEASQATGQPFSFNPGSAIAIATFNEINQRVVSLLMEQQNEALLEMQRMAAQIEPIRSFRMIRQGVTLTGRQVRAVDNFRRMLEDGSSEALTRQLRDKRFDPTLRRAIAGELSLTTDQIDNMVSRYIDRQLRFRARTIAATEATRLANESDNVFWHQAVETDQVETRQIERMWVTSLDEKVRSSHRHAQGQKRGLNEPFRTGDGNNLRFPGDPRAPASDTINCRCWVRTKYIELSEFGEQAGEVAA